MAANEHQPAHLRVGEVASLAGVSPQTIRLWETQGLLHSERTSGRQRVFSAAQADRAVRIAGLRRRHKWNPAAIRSALTDDASEPAPTIDHRHEYGPRIRAARKAKGLTLEQASRKAGISRSTLSSIELGYRTVTPHLLSSIADALGLTMTAFVPATSSTGRVLRSADRPITTMAGGVRWEELATPGRGLEPALLVVPAGGSSGGDYTRPDEIWVCVLQGQLSVELGGEHELLEPGDAIYLEPDAVWRWHNDGDVETRAIYVERCTAARPPEAGDDSPSSPPSSAKPSR
jgi:DNA-binding transcriptional MerR regulator/quercetin dioxygenase-like cupin family protein